MDIARIESEVTGRMVERALAQAGAPGGRPVEEMVNETLFHERERLKKARGERAEADRAFYSVIRHELPHASPQARVRLLREVVEHYVDEISGRFDERVYAVSTRALPVALSALMTSLSPRRIVEEKRVLTSVDEQLVIDGDLELLRRLQSRGTLVLAPTHSSNLDSVIMGYAIYRMGLPPAAYGAGLNLFGNPIIGFFMRHLGAYTVDRLKTDPLYRDILKEYATVSLEHGQNNLFFPGGTRSRSGAIETHLKKGLLGCGLAAFRNNLQHRKAQPNIYIVPCTVSYPLVLEASTLIEDYLAEAGRSRYIIVDDEFSLLRRWVAFLRGLVEIDLNIHLRVGRPLDVFGNDVDAEGRSLDPRGRPVDAARYVMQDGRVVEDAARDAEYTRALASRIVEAYHRDNTVQATHALAFVMFELLRRQSTQTDLYRFLRTLDVEISLSQATVEEEMERLLRELHALAQSGRITLTGPIAARDVPGTVRHALTSFGTYHTTPVIERRGVRLHVGDAKLLFYYRNRLEGYGLLGAPELLPRREA